MSKQYCIIHKPSGDICELERRGNGQLVCFMVYPTIEDAQRAADIQGAEEYSAAELPAGIAAYQYQLGDKLPYYHPYCRAAENAWFDLYELSDDLKELSDRELSIAADNFTEGYIVAMLSIKKGK